MRLIDADELLSDMREKYNSPCPFVDASYIDSAKVVCNVRCVECKHAQKFTVGEATWYRCKHTTSFLKPTDFCSKGEVRHK